MPDAPDPPKDQPEGGPPQWAPLDSAGPARPAGPAGTPAAAVPPPPGAAVRSATPPGWPDPPPSAGWSPPPAAAPATLPPGWPAPPYDPAPQRPGAGTGGGPAGALAVGGSASTGPLPLHPMRVSDILDGAFKLLKANARTLVVVTGVFVVPVQLLAAFAQRQLFGGQGIVSFINDPASARVESESGNGQLAIILFASIASILVVPLVAGAVSRVVAASYLGDRLEPGPALRAVGRRWWVFVVAWFAVHLAEGIGILLCIFPGLLVMALFVAVAPVIAVEGLGPLRAMRRSAHLVRPRMFPVLGIVLLSGILANVVGSALGFVPQSLAFLVGLKWGWLLLAAGAIVSALVTTPFVAIVATLVYFDGRIRQEGLDLQVMAADVAARTRR